MFYDPHQFGFTQVLEDHWRAIYAEYLGVQRHLIDWYEKDLYEAGWQVYGVYDFPHGDALSDGVRRCPLTASLISRHIPGHGAAGFSVLHPGTRIKPHTGYAGQFLRCHVGLRIPAGDCGLQVGGETRTWEEGKAIVFDDRLTHAAWNMTTEARIILLVDFVPES
jgi:beta-hydroxylase